MTRFSPADPPGIPPLLHDPRRLRFFLGGRDLEMATVAALVRDTLGPETVLDKGLAWGARASAYGDEIATAAASGHTPVLVELAPDIALPAGVIVVDHHGERVGEPCALAQVFGLLDLPRARWTRHFELVARNDVGHVAAMRASGASEAEMAAIRAADRRAQGVTAAEEEAGRAALAAAEPRGGGSLLLVRLAHQRAATVTDPLALAGGPAPALLVLMPGEAAFFGPGQAVRALNAAFPGGWSGGELPARGFWGIKPSPGEAGLLRALCRIPHQRGLGTSLV